MGMPVDAASPFLLPLPLSLNRPEKCGRLVPIQLAILASSALLMQPILTWGLLLIGCGFSFPLLQLKDKD